MFELSVASKYLIPRKRQLSVSIISLISVLVIALVVWLIVVFFSVTNGLEKNWISKLITLTAPVRVTPTDAYYNSYYYLIDTISDDSNYSSKTIGEKLEAASTDPYNPDVDEEIPAFWPEPDQHSDGSVKDLVKILYQSIDQVGGASQLRAKEFQMTGTHISLQLHRYAAKIQGHNIFGSTAHSELSYPAYLGNFESDNTPLKNTLLPVTEADLTNFLTQMHDLNQNFPDEIGRHDQAMTPEQINGQINNFMDLIDIRRLKTRLPHWTIPRTLLPLNCRWDACAVVNQDKILRIVIPQQANENEAVHKYMEEQGLKSLIGQLIIEEGEPHFTSNHGVTQALSQRVPISLAGGSVLSAELDKESLKTAHRPENVQFNVSAAIQGTMMKGEIPYRNLEIDLATVTDRSSPPWVHQVQSDKGMGELVLPRNELGGEGVILPKNFKDAGVLLGDRGTLSYFAPTTSVLQEQLIPIYVAGFYDPGLIPIGGKFILANPETTALIRGSHQQDNKLDITNGVNIRLSSLDQAVSIKEKLQEALKNRGIARYWTVESYKDYEFTKEIMQELQSQKHLFMLIAIVIILVACSNIISMLIILVNDKKIEIGILRSMGATSASIALIFGSAGAIIGILGSAIGITAAIITLNNLDILIGWLSQMQGHEMFSSSLYGQFLPSELSFEALAFVLGATVAISLLAGIVPAVKACMLKPSQILRSAGG
jgi:lipoprotein-releasing system permease protein